MADDGSIFRELKALRDLIAPVWQWLTQGRAEQEQADASMETERKEVLIVGPGGIDKTTFARLISLDYDFRHECPGEYQESISVEKYQIQ